MRNINTSRFVVRLGVVGALLSMPICTLAAPKKEAKAPGVFAIQSVERATGKKLTSAQKAQITQAAKERDAAIAKVRKAEMKKFRAKVAKAAGLSLSQLEAKEKAARGAKSKAKPKA